MALLSGLRVGHGYDVHRFASTGSTDGGEGTVIMLAGVAVPAAAAVEAHSDGDLLAHALCDALLGAAALGDIGHHFPDTDPRWAGASGETLVTATRAAVSARGLDFVNADLTLVAQAPRVAPYIGAMRQTLCRWLACAPDRVNLKATTTEKLGFEGRREGLAAHAVVLLLQRS